MTPWQQMLLMYLGIIGSIGANVYGAAIVISYSKTLKALVISNSKLTDRLSKVEAAFASLTGTTINGTTYRMKEED
jgi:hypothetical protein